MIEQASPLEVFCSYAHKDEVRLHKLIAYMRLLEREGLVLFWHDRLLTGGMDWAQELREPALKLTGRVFSSTVEMKEEESRVACIHHERRMLPLAGKEMRTWGRHSSLSRSLRTSAQPITTWSSCVGLKGACAPTVGVFRWALLPEALLPPERGNHGIFLSGGVECVTPPSPF